MPYLIKSLALVAGAFVGLVLFHFAAVLAFCLVFFPGSNQCGLPAMLFVAPLGAVVGAVAGWLIAGRILRRRAQTQAC